jgi:hypothetical protein
MLMFYTSDGVTQLWNHFLQDNAKGRNSNFHIIDYHVICAVSPYFMLHPTKLSAWFIVYLAALVGLHLLEVIDEAGRIPVRAGQKHRVCPH